MMSLNHYWTINEQSGLSTVLYLSIGDGGGYAWRGTDYSGLYGTNTATGKLNREYRKNGYMDYEELQRKNAAAPNGSVAVITDSRNNHTWTGLMSTYSNKLTSNIDFYGGVDLRYYAGLHDGKIVDLMGGEYFVDPARKNVANSKNTGNAAWINEKLKEGDVVYRDNTGYVAQAGVFGQLEYLKDQLSAFVSGSVSNSSYWKVDRFYYDNEKSDVGNFIGFTMKGGANYNLTSKHNVYTNVGYISRAPFMSGGYFTNIHQSNTTNPNAVNEKLFSMELGYGYRFRIFTANVNLYHTNWIDKTMIRSLGSNLDDGTINLEGVNALHQGIEVEMVFKPIEDLSLKGMFSLGNWRWTNAATGYAYNRDGQAVDNSNNVVEPLSPEHAMATVDMKGVKVGGSAQTQFAIGAQYKFLKDFSIGADYKHEARNYADFNISTNAGTTVYRTPWMIPEFGTVDLNAHYNFKIGGLDAVLMGNINNLLDQEYIADAKDLKAADSDTSPAWENVAVMYGFGRTFSVAVKINF
jgi:hypothetical protein